ncbi:putative glucan 1 3-beta-glucosidase A [Bienertia sinuspersici]
MRNTYAHQHLQQEDEQQHHQQRSKFLPMLCSSSTKQVIKLSVSHRRNSSTSSSSSSTVSEDPLSPRVGCMGQVKRNNKVVGFPSKSFISGFTTSTTTIKSHDQISNNIVKYYKIKRFFSPKNLTSSPTTTSVVKSGTHKGGNKNNNNKNRGIRGNNDVLRVDHGNGVISRSKIDSANNKMKNTCANERGSFVNLMDLDPPLPVVKQQQQQEQKQGNDGEENVSLWKRRSRGAPLKSLQVQQSCNLLPQPTTV